MDFPETIVYGLGWRGKWPLCLGAWHMLSCFSLFQWNTDTFFQIPNSSKVDFLGVLIVYHVGCWTESYTWNFKKTSSVSPQKIMLKKNLLWKSSRRKTKWLAFRMCPMNPYQWAKFGLTWTSGWKKKSVCCICVFFNMCLKRQGSKQNSHYFHIIRGWESSALGVYIYI